MTDDEKSRRFAYRKEAVENNYQALLGYFNNLKDVFVVFSDGRVELWQLLTPMRVPPQAEGPYCIRQTDRQGNIRTTYGGSVETILDSLTADGVPVPHLSMGEDENQEWLQLHTWSGHNPRNQIQCVPVRACLNKLHCWTHSYDSHDLLRVVKHPQGWSYYNEHGVCYGPWATKEAAQRALNTYISLHHTLKKKHKNPSNSCYKCDDHYAWLCICAGDCSCHFV